MSSSTYRGITKNRWKSSSQGFSKCTCHNQIHTSSTTNLIYIQKKNYSLWKTLTSTITNNTTSYTFNISSSSSSSTTINIEHLIQSEFDNTMHEEDTPNDGDNGLLSIPSSNIKSFLESFTSTMKKSMKHAVTQQSLAIQNRALRSELQSKDTYKFIANAQQALFEEIMAEKIWYLYHFQHNKYSHGVPINVLYKYLLDEMDDNMLITNDKTFEQRLLSLTKVHASYQQDIWLRMHQLPFYQIQETMNDKTGTKPFVFKKRNKKTKNLHKIMTEDVIGCNIDRTGRIAWYYKPNENLIFFPGIFEPDTIFISNALKSVNELNKLLIKSQNSRNTHILLQSSAVLENAKIAFFEQELWRFLTYYPSGGHYHTLLNCYNLFGVPSKDIMKQYLNKYIYFDKTENNENIAIQYDKQNNFFNVNKRPSLMEQINEFQEHHYTKLEELKNSKFINTLNEEYNNLFTSCLSQNCRLFYDIKLLKCIFWSWCHVDINNKNNCNIFPDISHFQIMSNELMNKYQESINESLGGANRYLTQLSQYEYQLLRQLWYIGIKHNVFIHPTKHITKNSQFMVQLTDIASNNHDINWFISIMNARVANNVAIDQFLIYNTIFNAINDIIPKLSSDNNQKPHQQLTQLMRILNNAYSKLPKTVHVIPKDSSIPNLHTPQHGWEVTKTYDQIQDRFMQLFIDMAGISNYDALSELKIKNMHSNFLSNLAAKCQITLESINSMESLRDIMAVNTTKNISKTRLSPNMEVVGFHHNLKQRKFDEALNILQRFNSTMVQKRGRNSYSLNAALKLVTLPPDSRIWRTAREYNRNKLNLHPLKIEIPSIINLCIENIPKLPLDQNQMAHCLQPIPSIMEHVTKEHGSMKIAHEMFKNILSTPELPLPLSMVLTYLDLYSQYDEFLSSPIPILESILKRYIPPSIISSNIGHAQFEENGMIDNALKDFTAMSKTDGIDDKLDPFASFNAESGYHILPQEIYAKMLKLLNQYSSVHGFGHFNMDQASIYNQKSVQTPQELKSMHDAAKQDGDQ